MNCYVVGVVKAPRQGGVERISRCNARIRGGIPCYCIIRVKRAPTPIPQQTKNLEMMSTYQYGIRSLLIHWSSSPHMNSITQFLPP